MDRCANASVAQTIDTGMAKDWLDGSIVAQSMAVAMAASAKPSR